MTMNSPASLMELFRLAAERQDQKQKVKIAELIREVGLKCIGFNGVCTSTASYWLSVLRGEAKLQ